jgi:hypothetical protein
LPKWNFGISSRDSRIRSQHGAEAGTRKATEEPSREARLKGQLMMKSSVQDVRVSFLTLLKIVQRTVKLVLIVAKGVILLKLVLNVGTIWLVVTKARDSRPFVSVMIHIRMGTT